MDEQRRWLEQRGVASALRGARIAQMAVATRGGPLLSAQLFGIWGGRVWLIASRSSVRVRVLRRRPEVGLLLLGRDRTLVVAGTAEILEPWGPGAALYLALSAPAVAGALLDYATRNTARMVGFAAELLRVPPRREAIPIDRVLVAVTPERGFAWDGMTVTDVMGQWPGAAGLDPFILRTPARATRRRAGVPSAVPTAVASLADAVRPCAVGWETADGPLALPATWDPHGWRAEVPAAVVSLINPQATATRACIGFDRSTALRPSSYSGLVLRGHGTLEATPLGGPVLLALDTERVSYWAGFHTATVDAMSPRPRAPRRAVGVPVRPRARRRARS